MTTEQLVKKLEDHNIIWTDYNDETITVLNSYYDEYGRFVEGEKIELKANLNSVRDWLGY